MNKTVRTAGAALLAVALAGAAAACSSSKSDSGSAKWSKADSAAAGGGMDALVAAAKQEGKLNVITLPRAWANYGKIMDDFSAKYGIKITDDNPEGSSGDEIKAIQSEKGQDRAPDVVDIGNSYALADGNLFSPYEVSTWSGIPASLKDGSGSWYGDYGGYIVIACDPAKVAPKSCPKSFKDLADPANASAYAGKLGINGDPTSANAAFSAVYAAALANGGSLDNIQPGLDFFKQLKKSGVFNPTKVTESTIQQGTTPITLDWEFNSSQYAADLKSKGINLQVAVPTDSLFSAYYDQAVNKDAPHPAAARLWEEYLYSAAGQNDFMGGYARPVEFDAMKSANSLDSAALANLPVVDGTPTYPTADQQTKAKALVTSGWAAAVQ